MTRAQRQSKMLALAAEYKSSELSMKAFASQHGVATSTISYWLSKNRKEQVKKKLFTPVQITGVDKKAIIIRCPNGTEIHVPVS